MAVVEPVAARTEKVFVALTDEASAPEPVTVREIKNDAIIDIKINKNFYLMLKATMMYIFKQEADTTKYEALIKKIMSSVWGSFSDSEDSD